MPGRLSDVTVRLTFAQAECLRMIRRGVNTTPPLRRDVLDGLLIRRMVEKFDDNGLTRYRETELGKRF